MAGEEPQIINSLASVRYSSKLNNNTDTPRQSYYSCWYCTHMYGTLDKDEELQTLSSEFQLSQGVSELFSRMHTVWISAHVCLPNDCWFIWVGYF